jgi:hypothetical protein
MFRQFSAPGIGPGQKLMTKSFSIKSFMHAANEKAKRAFRAMGILFYFLGFGGTICGFFCLRVVLHLLQYMNSFDINLNYFLFCRIFEKLFITCV